MFELFVSRTVAALADYTSDCILVDDGSGDATPRLLDRIADADHTSSR